MRAGFERAVRLPPLLALLLAAGGCVGLTPYEEVAARLPAGRLVEVAGQRVHVERWGAAGEPVLLLHGFGGSTYSWRGVGPRLGERHQVIAVDLNGFGYTERPRDLDAYTVSGQLALVLGVLDGMGLDRVHVAGHSYGGALALHLAWRHPERVRSLVLVDSAGPGYPSKRRHLLAGVGPLASGFVRAVGLRTRRVQSGLEASFHDDAAVTPELVAAYVERLRVEGISRAYRGLTAPRRERPEAGFDYAAIEQPVLVVWGAEDRLVAPEEGRAAAERMPQARFVLLDETGHIPPEERPAELARLIIEFLETGPGRTADPPIERLQVSGSGDPP